MSCYLQNYGDLYLECQQQQISRLSNYRDFQEVGPNAFKKKWQDHAGCVLQVKIKIRLKFFTKVDSQFSLSLCPKYSCISASRQRNLKIKLG